MRYMKKRDRYKRDIEKESDREVMKKIKRERGEEGEKKIERDIAREYER